MLCYINNAYLDSRDAKVSVTDLGLTRGYGVFDYLRTYHKRPFHLWDHLERLSYSAEQIGLKLPKTYAEIEEIIATLMKNNCDEEASIKIILTGGASRDPLLPDGNPTFIILVSPFHSPFSFTELKATTTSLARSFPNVKTLHYTPAIMALQQGKAQEALFLNSKKEILEGTTGNFFAFKDNVLYTADSEEVLFGITREIVFKLAAPHFEIKKTSLSLQDIPLLEEAFVTSSNKEIMPVIAIDQIQIGNGRPGTKTMFLQSAFDAYIDQLKWDPLKIPRYSSLSP